jgi:hypothetical protein
MFEMYKANKLGPVAQKSSNASHTQGYVEAGITASLNTDVSLDRYVN